SDTDPVRVYLREMGSVSLLSRQREIDLAQRIERGKYKMRKALSRSPLVLRTALAISEDVRQGRARIDEFVEVGGADDTAKDQARGGVEQRFAALGKLYARLMAAELKLEGVPERHVNVRVRLKREILRLKVL